jgi:hypothetical protein
MDQKTLLARFERLPYDERMKNLVQIGRESITNPHSQSLVSALASSSIYCPYEQLLAIETCFGSRDISLAFRILASPSKHLKKRAMGVITMFGTGDDVLKALKIQLPYLQAWALRRMRNAKKKRRRLDAVDSFLGQLRTQDRNRFRTLLPFGSTELVEQYLAEELDLFTGSDWYRLAKYHPDITLRELKAWADRSNEEDTLLLGTANVIMELWGKREVTVDRAVDLLKTMLKITPWVKLAVPHELLAKRPREVVGLMLAGKGDVTTLFFYGRDHQGFRKSRRFISSLSTSHLLELQERHPKLFPPINFVLEALTREQRVAIYNVNREAWRSTPVGSQGLFPINVISHLPATQRIAEARRHMKLKTFETRPADKIPYISMLPWEEAMELQAPFFKSNDASVRSSALSWQILSANYDSTRISDAVQLVVQRQHEQDPVRSPMMEALAKLAPSRWDAEYHLPDLEKSLYHALDAGDLSDRTVRAMLSLVARILSFHPSWAAAQLAHILKRRSYKEWSRYFYVDFRIKLAGRYPSELILGYVAREMAPTVKHLLVKKNVAPLVLLAETFKSNLWRELRDALEATLEFEHEPAHSEVLQILKNDRYRWHTWPSLIPGLLERESKIAGKQEVIDFISRHEQNLLPFYFKEKLAGEEVPRWKQDVLRRLTSGFWRWTASQQDSFATILLKDINDPEVAISDKMALMKRLSLLRFVDLKHLTHLARLEEEPAIREKALRALGRLDSNQGVPILIEALQDDRARVAMYALRSTLFKSIPSNEVFEILQAVPTDKVTIAKEKARLIGSLKTDEAFQYLINMENINLHPDVRIAMFRALWHFRERPETWEIFMRAAENPEPSIAKSVTQIPDNGMSTSTRQTFLKLQLKLLNHPNAEVRLDVLNRLRNTFLNDTECILGPRLLELVLSPLDTEAERAGLTIFDVYATAQPHVVAGVFRKVLSDKKMLQRLFNFYFRRLTPSNIETYLPSTHLILPILAADPLTTSLRVRLIIKGLPVSSQQQFLFDILPSLHADALSEAVRAIASGNVDTHTAVQMEKFLVNKSDERARRLALAFLRASVERAGCWTDEQRERLGVYWGDESVLVREAAAFIFPPLKDET